MIYPITIPTNSDLRSFNFFIVEGSKGLTLIDAGINHEACWQQFLQTLQCHQFLLEDINEIILTHSHEDHIGLIPRIIEKHNIPVYVHAEAIPRLKREKSFFEQRTSFYERLYREMGCGTEGEQRVQQLKNIVIEKQNEGLRADYRTLSENDYIINRKVIETPGHAPDHIALIDERNNVMLGGDHLIAHISSNALIEPYMNGERRKTVLEYVESLQKCLTYDIDYCYSGHGEQITNPHLLIHKRLKGIERKAEKFLSYVSEAEKTASEIARHFYPDKYYTQFSLVMSEVIGHLDYLEEKNKVEKGMENRVWQYKTVKHIK